MSYGIIRPQRVKKLNQLYAKYDELIELSLIDVSLQWNEII